MKNILENLKGFHPNSLSREIFYCISGLFFLIILNYLFKPAPEMFPHWQSFEVYEKDIILIITGYFFARFCCEIGGLIIDAIKSIFQKDKFNGLKKNLVGFKQLINQEPFNLVGDRKMFNSMELENFICSDTNLSFWFERKYQILNFDLMSVGFSFLLGIFYSPYIFLIALMILIKAIDLEYEIVKNKVDVAMLCKEIKRNTDQKS